MKFPEDLKYTREHEWVRVEGDIATVGITDFAQAELGDIVYVEVPPVGEYLEVNGVFGSIEAVKTVSDLFMPISGKVIEVNQEIDADPSLLNSDAYGAGWIIKVQLSDKAELDALLHSNDYQKLL